MSEGETIWCGVSVIVSDDVPHEDFILPLFDVDPAQEPTFTVTQSTLDLVKQDFESYKPILEYLLHDWREKKIDFIVAVARGAHPTKSDEGGKE